MCQITNSFCKMLSLHHSVNILLHLIEVPCSKIDYMYCSNMQLPTVQSTCFHCICLHCIALICIALHWWTVESWVRHPELLAAFASRWIGHPGINLPSWSSMMMKPTSKIHFQIWKCFLAAQRRWWWWWWWHGKKWGMEEASRSRVTLVIPVSQ